MIGRPGECEDASPQLLTQPEFDDARSLHWAANKNPALNRKRDVVTAEYKVLKKADREGERYFVEILESISPDLHIFTNSVDRDGRFFFFSICSDRIGRVTTFCVNSNDFDLVRQIQEELIKSFKTMPSDRHNIVEAVKILLYSSSYSQMRGLNGARLLTEN